MAFAKKLGSAAQNFGKFLGSMIMPNIGAFIAWGLMTAIFMANGWFPNEKIATLIQPTLRFLLPLLIAYQGGKLVGGDRGAVMGAIAGIGVIIGSDIPMFIGAMCIGPFAGLVIKYFDKWVGSKVKESVKVLVDNFSVGILGICCAILGLYAIGPVVSGLTNLLAVAVRFLIDRNLIPALALVVEPAKVVFLNGALNYGIFTPVAVTELQSAASTIVFLIESNPAPGFGVLLAYCFFGKGSMKASAPGAAIIHALGGIHEIYFPYVLANPALLLATIGGSVCTLIFYTITGAGVVGPVAPGSVVALLAMAPKGQTLLIFAGFLIGTVVSFLIASPIVKANSKKQTL